MILDDGGDATLYVLLGARAEAGEDVLSRADLGRGRGDQGADHEAHGGKPRLVHQDARRDQGRVGRDHHRRAPAL